MDYGERLLQVDWPRALSWKRAGRQLYEQAGVYPCGKETFYRFVNFFREILPQCDVLVAWFNKGEDRLLRRYAPQAKLVTFYVLGYPPYKVQNPWPAALAGKKVLLVSPFTETARAQHARLGLVWPKNPEMRAAYSLQTLRTPLHAHLIKEPQYADWFAGHEQLCAAMDAVDYDVALIGCGAWSLPLCVHARKRGKIGIHLGGVTQLFYGIRGKRWDEHPPLVPLYNEYWVRPSGEEAPKNAVSIESGCYW